MRNRHHYPRATGPRLLAAAAAACLTASALAHEFAFTRTLVIFPSDGTFQIDLTVDLDELALGLPPGSDSEQVAARLRAMPPEELQRTLADLRRLIHRRVKIRFDDKKHDYLVSFPHHQTPLAAAIEPPTVLGLTLRLEGRVPPDAQTFSFFASRAFQAVHLIVFRSTTDEILRLTLPVGARSPAIPLQPTPGEPSRLRDPRTTAGRYLIVGFEHILPWGLDHILFVLGLFLLAVRLKPLLWQVTAFTIAHSVTLALALYDVVSLPASIVEPLIAASIVYVALENLFTDKLHVWRPIIVFAFGLLHGMGFAGVLLAWGLPPDQKLLALAMFNIGVELGQLAVIGIALATIGWARQRPWYRPRVAIPLSLLIALIALYWTVERTLATLAAPPETPVPTVARYQTAQPLRHFPRFDPDS